LILELAEVRLGVEIAAKVVEPDIVDGVGLGKNAKVAVGLVATCCRAFCNCSGSRTTDLVSDLLETVLDLVSKVAESTTLALSSTSSENSGNICIGIFRLITVLL